MKAVETRIAESRLTRAKGIPKGSFTVVLHGQSPRASKQLADMLRTAAMLYDVSATDGRREGDRGRFTSYVTHEDFVPLIKELMNGELPAQVDGEMGEIWDVEEMLDEQQDGWPRYWHEILPNLDFEEPSEV